MIARMIALSLALAGWAQAGALHDAARACDEERMRRLLADRPPVDEKDADGKTPLHVAIEAEKVACVELLIAAGADRLARDGEGRDAMRAAAAISEPATQRAVHRALIGPYAERAIARAAGRADGTPQAMPWSLEHTVTHGQTDVTRMLLSMGVDPNAPGTQGKAPLADAALQGDLEAVRLLIAAGARVDVEGPTGVRPIHDAALGGFPAVVRELVEHGAAVDGRTREDGRTPLHLAALMGRVETVEALLALGADRSLRDEAGRTARELAERAELDQVVAAFLKAEITPE